MNIELTGDFNGFALWINRGHNTWLIAKFRTLTAAARAMAKANAFLEGLR